ncbi:ComEC/Rec2 family competence protein [Candidatus Midichloria mitochondrii]|uniref:ComEC/Rec2 family competence protein n=1 Tax=Candidatus Midichloria mitochondrii TaxID=234827 RepID=UPI00397730F9
MAYHFKQFSVYSTPTNLISVPLNNLPILPLGLIALISMPLGLENIALKLMNYGTDWLIYTSHLISNTPNATMYMPFFLPIYWPER